MENGTTNWGQSVTGVVIKDNKVLLARHTYGGGKGLLIVPGGYVNVDETPQDALVREYMEETKVTVKPLDIIGIRFNISGDLKMQKPDERIFLLTAEKLGVKPEECFYVDDRRNNLEAAKKLGMKPVLLNSRNVSYAGNVVGSFEELLDKVL